MVLSSIDLIKFFGLGCSSSGGELCAAFDFSSVPDNLLWLLPELRTCSHGFCEPSNPICVIKGEFMGLKLCKIQHKLERV
jgi:hypothetical protein